MTLCVGVGGGGEGWREGGGGGGGMGMGRDCKGMQEEVCRWHIWKDV